jgi:hypothetical protein
MVTCRRSTKAWMFSSQQRKIPMAQFKCGKCGHQQRAADSKIGRVAKCPVCHVEGTVTSGDRESAQPPNTPSAPAEPQSGVAPARNWTQTLLLMTVGLLACSVLLQALILQRIPVTTNQPVPVSIARISTLDELPVSIGSEPVSVSISDISTTTSLPVTIDGISTTDELKVNLYNHYILGGDPIPVEIVH